MLRVKSCITFVICSVLCLLTSARSESPAFQSPEGNQLVHKAGWISIGYLRRNGDKWATEVYHEFLRRPSGPPSLIPAKGDVLRLKKAFPLYLTGYGQTGEARRLESPANRILTDSDATGIRVPAESVVCVEDVAWETVVEHMGAVWFRVTPANGPSTSSRDTACDFVAK